MPTYEYKCTKCEEMFEVFQKMSAEPLKTCAVCGGDLVKLISGGLGIIFKGNGFYTTDYRKSASTGSTGAGERSSEPAQAEKEVEPSTKDSGASDSAKKSSTTKKQAT